MQDKSKIAVYVAGPYSSDNVIGVQQNIRRGIERAALLFEFGYTIYCPWLDFQLGLFGNYPVELYQRNSMEWLRRSDCVLLVEGWENSKGTKAESDEAKRLGKPVFEHLDQLDEWAENIEEWRRGQRLDCLCQVARATEEESVG